MRWPCAAARGAAAQEHVALQLKWKHQFQFAGYYAAVEKGYYREAGFSVALIEAGEGADPIDEVLAGRAQYGVGASEIALRRAQGKPLVVLAVVLQHSPLVLLARGGRTQSVHELAGKRIMLMPLRDRAVRLPAARGHAARRHRRAAAQLQSRRPDQGQGRRGLRLLDRRALPAAQGAASPTACSRRARAGIDFYGDTLFTSEAQVRKGRARVDAFRRASLRGWQYAMDNPGEIADLIRSRYSDRHSREHLLFEAEEMRRLMQPQLVEIGYSNPGRWNHIASVYAEVGMLPPGRSLDGLAFDPSRRRST